ncbi:MAG: hypothetical protein M3P85_14290 [Actinomycetota bacterium]|nr:hypothetical protein [Actinomycetota bacterium]
MSERADVGSPPSSGKAPKASDLRARLFVWSVWTVMVVAVLACIARYAHNVPLAEDWLLVPPLTGHEPDLASWLWAQNNEHRLPLPRLALLGLLRLTGGDFRSGMVFNVVLLAALSAGMILVARRLRGRTSVADAFFPVALLHLGNWANLVWGWQLQFVLSTTLVCCLLLLLVTQRTTLRPGPALAAGVCLVMLPLTGANGLVFVPLLAAGMVWEGLRLRRARGSTGVPGWAPLWLVGSSVVAVLISGLYFVGWERPSWNASAGTDVGAAAETSAKFFALGLGPGASRSWKLSILAVSAVLLTALVLVVRAVLQRRGVERHRAIGLCLFLGAAGLLAVVLGWGRPAGPGQALPERYVLLAVPALCAAYFASQLYSPPTVRRLMQGGLLAVMIVMLPINTSDGFTWRDWYGSGMGAVERDLDAGIPRSQLAARHQSFLLHWNLDMLEANMEMLRRAGIGPFRHLQPDPTGLAQP